MRPKIRYANVVYMSLILAMGRKSVVVRALFVFGSIWNIVKVLLGFQWNKYQPYISFFG